MASAGQGLYTETAPVGAHFLAAPTANPMGVLGGDVLEEGQAMEKREQKLQDKFIDQKHWEMRQAALQKHQKGVLENERTYKESKEEEARGRLLDPESPEGKEFAMKQRKDEADIKLKGAQTDYYTSGKNSNKTDSKPSPYTRGGKPMTIGEAKLLYKEYEDIDREEISKVRRQAIANAVADIDENIGLKGEWWTTKADAEAFVQLVIDDPDTAMTKDKAAYDAVVKSLEGTELYKGFQDWIDRSFGETTEKQQSPTSKAVQDRAAKLGVKL